MATTNDLAHINDLYAVGVQGAARVSEIAVMSSGAPRTSIFIR